MKKYERVLKKPTTYAVIPAVYQAENEKANQRK